MNPLFVKQDIILMGILEGMKNMGATFDKVDGTHFYFTIKRDSEIDNDKRLLKAKEIFMEMYGLGLKFKRVK